MQDIAGSPHISINLPVSKADLFEVTSFYLKKDYSYWVIEKVKSEELKLAGIVCCVVGSRRANSGIDLLLYPLCAGSGAVICFTAFTL